MTASPITPKSWREFFRWFPGKHDSHCARRSHHQRDFVFCAATRADVVCCTVTNNADEPSFRQYWPASRKRICKGSADLGFDLRQGVGRKAEIFYKIPIPVTGSLLEHARS